MTKPGKPKKRVEQQSRPQSPELERRNQDVSSTRAKSSAHKKVTADKSNQ